MTDEVLHPEPFEPEPTDWNGDFQPREVNIGPGSLLWEYAGDWRIGHTGLSANILQLMHPAIGAGVEQQSTMFQDPWGRVFRSISQILDVVYAPNGVEAGHHLRDRHTHVHGNDAQGRSYNALNPETFWWPHATFHDMTERLIDNYDIRNLTSNEREQLYRETTAWYTRYGMSMQPVPENYAAFREKWDWFCDEKLEMTHAAQWLVDKLYSGNIEAPPAVPRVVWGLGGFAMKSFLHLTAIGGLPARVRERFDLPWSKTDAAKLAFIATSTKLAWPFIPEKLRYHPHAWAGIQRARHQNTPKV